MPIRVCVTHSLLSDYGHCSGPSYVEAHLGAADEEDGKDWSCCGYELRCLVSDSGVRIPTRCVGDKLIVFFSSPQQCRHHGHRQDQQDHSRDTFLGYM